MAAEFHDDTVARSILRSEPFRISQAILFVVEGAILAVALAALSGIIAFAGLAQLSKQFGIAEDAATAVNFLILVSVVVSAFATVSVVFVGYLRLLSKPIIGRILCALGSLGWAVPIALLAALLVRHQSVTLRFYGGIAAYAAACVLLYVLKRQALKV